MIRILEAATAVEGVFVIGGQASNFWADLFANNNEELKKLGPFTSHDIDFFGTKNEAQKIADILGAAIAVPGAADNTPNSAILKAEVDGVVVLVDFLDHVLGVSDAGLKKRVVKVWLPTDLDGKERNIPVYLMHPIDCLASRVANILKLKRQDEIAKKQLRAAPLVLAESVEQMVAGGDTRKAGRILKLLRRYLRSDQYGRLVHRLEFNDPLDILRRYVKDERLDYRYRHYLSIWISEIEGRRKNLEARLLAVARRKGKV